MDSYMMEKMMVPYMNVAPSTEISFDTFKAVRFSEESRAAFIFKMGL